MSNNWWQAPVRALDGAAEAAALARQQQLTKPAGSLGELEAVAVRLAALQGREKPQLERPWISIFAADHGAAAAGISAFPQAVTAQMVANFATGGAAICVLAREIGAHFEVVDAGVLGDTSIWPGVVQDKVAAGSASWLEQPAMTAEQLDAALAVGQRAVARALSAGADCFIAGEMGIGNTASASALAAVWLGASAGSMTGPGTGLDPLAISRKADIIAGALALHRPRLTEPQTVLATLGGFEIAALAGAYIAAAQAGLPVLVDGFICTVAALSATRLNARARDWMLFAHQSQEPAHSAVLAALQARPLLKLGMRLGEGSGAAAAFPLLRLACALHGQMATFAEAGVSNKEVT